MRTAAERAFPGVAMILEERMRQKTEEGFTSLHDDMHDRAELADAAGCYCAMATLNIQIGGTDDMAEGCPPSSAWPFNTEDWKPSADPIRNLTRAGALIAAEIERLIRQRGTGPGDQVRSDPAAELTRLLAGMTLPIRMLKIQEEAGEAADAYIGWVGANPRKGVYKKREDLEEELLDCALTALIAWCDVTHGEEPTAALVRHSEARLERQLREVGNA